MTANLSSSWVPHVLPNSRKIIQHGRPHGARQPLAPKAEQDVDTIPRAHFDTIELPLKTLAILLEELRFLNEVAFRFGPHFFYQMVHRVREAFAACL